MELFEPAEPFDGSYEVAVWDTVRREYTRHIPCPGEKRVRLDVHDSLDIFRVYKVKHENGYIILLEPKPLADWRIDLS